MTKKFSLLWFALLSFLFMNAQDSTVEMADTMRQNGKIYVVVAVVLTILVGLFLYLIRLDRKISNVEKNNFNF
ncbi:MAG TPA: CcmD family protein [Flavisolibacter sp.]|nr:CcmD family protein [Flavisolibacter sp.]